MLPEAADVILDQADYYERESGERLARRWHLAVDSLIRRIALNPELGAPAFASIPRFAGLRRISVPRFPNHLLFYRYSKPERLVTIENLMHGARDIEALLRTSEP
jgi:plasmid stabilization system protein ParE